MKKYGNFMLRIVLNAHLSNHPILFLGCNLSLSRQRQYFGHFLFPTISSWSKQVSAVVSAVLVEFSSKFLILVSCFNSLSGPQLTHSNSLRGKSTFSVEEVLLATDNFSETKFIGSGGQSTVYKGIIRGTTVAVKKFHDASINELLSEVNFSLRHPHVVLVLGCCQEANCVVSEFLPGGSLHDRLVDPNGLGLNAGDILRISLEMLSALMFLHNENIAHRDLKPANVLLDEHKKVKIADMGMAVKVEGAKDYGLFGTEG